jgi:hypothetical protein
MTLDSFNFPRLLARGVAAIWSKQSRIDREQFEYRRRK